MTEMTEVVVDVRFEVSEGTDLEQTAQFIEEHLSSLDMVKEAEAVAEGGSRIPGLAKIPKTIGAAIVVVRSSRELIEEVRKLITEFKELSSDMGLKDISVQVGKRYIPLEKIGEEDLKQLWAITKLPLQLEREQLQEQAADVQRAHATAQSTLQEKQETGDFDVFLCYNSADRVAILSIGAHLKDRGLLPWLDEWELRPGLPWQRVLEQQIGQIKSAAIFVGRDGIELRKQMEVEAFLRQFVKRTCPVIPVILPNAAQETQLPLFLEGMTWVDFRKQDPEPLERLIWGITGKRGPNR